MDDTGKARTKNARNLNLGENATLYEYLRKKKWQHIRKKARFINV